MSKQVSNNPRKFLGALKLRPTDYTGLWIAGTRITAYVLAEVATFATPSPALLDVNTELGLLRDAIKGKGIKYNRASKVNNITVKAQAQVVRIMLLQLLEYVLSTVGVLNIPNLQGAQTFATTGYAFRNVVSNTGRRMLPPRNLKLVNTSLVPASARYITWTKPQGLKKGARPESYTIHTVGLDINVPLRFIATVTKTSYQVPILEATAPQTHRIMVVANTRNGISLPAYLTIQGIPPAPEPPIVP